MKNKHKNNADAIKYLSALCEKEVQKPVEKMDCQLIASTVELLLKLQGKKVSLAEKEIEEKVRKIPFTESSDNVKEFKVNKNVRTKTTQKRILLIAAVIAILIAILSFVSVAFEWNIHDIMKEKFGSVHRVPVGEEQIENGISFTNNGNNRIYKSIDEFTVEETPVNELLLPNNCSIKLITVCEIDNKNTITITFTDETLSCTIVEDETLPLYLKQNKSEIFITNNLICYFENLEDVQLVQLHFQYNNTYYKFTGNDKQILLDLVENLEEQE